MKIPANSLRWSGFKKLSIGKLEDAMAVDEDGSPFSVLEIDTELLKTAWTALEGSTAASSNTFKINATKLIQLHVFNL